MSIAITARRSRLHPGTRYLARGLNGAYSTGRPPFRSLHLYVINLIANLQDLRQAEVFTGAASCTSPLLPHLVRTRNVLHLEASCARMRYHIDWIRSLLALLYSMVLKL